MNQGKRALVTGGSGGIGAAICRRLEPQGLHVYIHAPHGSAAAEALVAHTGFPRARPGGASRRFASSTAFS